MDNRKNVDENAMLLEMAKKKLNWYAMEASEEEFDEEAVEFYVLEQTKVNGVSYLLVTDSDDDDAECLIMKDLSEAEDTESVYEIVEDEVELEALLKVFEELLEDVDIEM